MCRYHLTRELAALGFEATPFSFFHPRYGIVIEYKTRPHTNVYWYTENRPLKRPWIVSVDGITLKCKVGRRWVGGTGKRYGRYSDALYAAYAGLSIAGAQDKQPNYYRTGKKL